MLTLGWPQIVMIGLWFMSIGIEITKHGQQNTGMHNGWTTLIAVLISCFILYSGGFFG